jgi:hypothetical protein
MRLAGADGGPRRAASPPPALPGRGSQMARRANARVYMRACLTGMPGASDRNREAETRWGSVRRGRLRGDEPAAKA